jgi:prolyl-tRNA synthetase
MWPASAAPFEVHVVALAAGTPEVAGIAEGLMFALEDAGRSVLLDDRDERPGEKFADADLIGCPVRITVGKKTLDDGHADVRVRQTRAEERISVGEIPARMGGLLDGA